MELVCWFVCLSVVFGNIYFYYGEFGIKTSSRCRNSRNKYKLFTSTVPSKEP